MTKKTKVTDKNPKAYFSPEFVCVHRSAKRKTLGVVAIFYMADMGHFPGQHCGGGGIEHSPKKKVRAHAALTLCKHIGYLLHICRELVYPPTFVQALAACRTERREAARDSLLVNSAQYIL